MRSTRFVAVVFYLLLISDQIAKAEELSRANGFVVADDLEFELLLEEPEVRQPVHLSFDERGRLWVVQYLQYPAPAGLTALSHDNYWRAQYDKVPPPPPNHRRGKGITSTPSTESQSQNFSGTV